VRRNALHLSGRKHMVTNQLFKEGNVRGK
jgi:hypothetical protein